MSDNKCDNDTIYIRTIKALWENYLKTGAVDEDAIKNIAKEAYDKVHLAYLRHIIEDIKNDVVESFYEKNPFAKESYAKIVFFFKKLRNILSRYYAISYLENFELLESMLYTEDVMSGFLRSSKELKDAIKKGFIELTPPSITFDARACPVYKEIENSAVEDDIKKELHKAHERIHCAAKYFYKLIEQGDIDNLYGIYLNIEYIGILMITTVALHKLKDQNEFYKTFFEGHSIPMLFVDIDTYSIADANKAALMFYGYTKEEITSLKNWDINILGEEKMKELVRKAKHKELNFFKFKHRLKSGEIRDVEVYSSPVYLGGKTYLLSIINDITKEERTRKALEIFKEIENLGITSDNEDIFFEKLLDVLEKEDMFKDICILRKQKNGFYINSSSDTCIEDVNKEINFPIIKAFNTKSTIYYKDSNEIEDDAIRKKLIEKEALSSIAMPISENGNIYGSICICSKVKNYFEDYKEILSNLKDRIENALKTIELRKKLNYQNDLVNSIVKNTQVGVIVFDEDNIYYKNDYLLDLLGYTHEDIKTLSIFDILSPIHVKDIIEALTNKTPIILQEFHIVNKKSQTIYVKGSLNFMKDIENKLVAVLTFVDITKEKELSDKLLKESETLKNLLEEANLLALLFKIKNISDLEIEMSYATKQFKLTVGEGVRSCLDFLALTDDQKELLMHHMRDILAGKERIADISGVKLKQIENSVFKLSIAKVLQGDELFILCVLYDITQEASLMKYFENLSIEDALTGIYNRRYLENKLEEYMNLAQRHDRPLSLIMFDIDFFKHINDSFGHDVGDKVLKAIAKVVSENIRNTDIFARYGGEEFIIIAPETTKEDAKTLAEKLRVSIENLYLEDGIHVTCSFGVVSLEKPDTKETLLKRVDDALYEAKKTGRNKVVVA